MPAFYIAPEASIKYELVGPDGTRAVLNDPNDADFVGYLDGEEALSGIDSPEIRDSYADLADTDGGMAGTNFASRRPIVMNGKVFPTSAADRNAKLGKLMAATNALRADGTMTWTPTGGEPVFVKFRRQLPFRAKGGFNKEFQIGLVCADPRIYTQRAFTLYNEISGVSSALEHRRFTWSSGSGTTVGSRSLYLPPGTYTIKVPVRSSQTGRTLSITTNGTNTGSVQPTANGSWQTAQVTFTKATAETAALIVSATVNTALTAGNFFDVGDIIVESAAGQYPSASATMASNWAAGSGYTASMSSLSPPAAAVLNPGNSQAYPRLRMIGPFNTLVYYVYTDPPYSRITLSSTYSASDTLVIDFGYRAVVKNGTGSDYGSVLTADTSWNGLPPDIAISPRIRPFSAATGATRAELTWRGTWI